MDESPFTPFAVSKEHSWWGVLAIANRNVPYVCGVRTNLVPPPCANANCNKAEVLSFASQVRKNLQIRLRRLAFLANCAGQVPFHAPVIHSCIDLILFWRDGSMAEYHIVTNQTSYAELEVEVLVCFESLGSEDQPRAGRVKTMEKPKGMRNIN